MSDILIKCVTCGGSIDADRLEGLAVLGKLPHEYTCINCAPTNRVRGIAVGSGNHQILVVNNLGQEGIPKENSVETAFDK